METRTLTLSGVRQLAQRLHAGQTDKAGKPYFLHVEAVAKALVSFGEYGQMVGYLHDTVEDTDITLDGLRAEGVPEVVVLAVGLMSRNLYPETSTYMDMIRAIAEADDSAVDRLEAILARACKIADNAHNSREDRVILGATEEARRGMMKRYAKARPVLYAGVYGDDIRAILEIVNPKLLAELPY